AGVRAPASLDEAVAALGPAELSQRLYERRLASLSFRIVRGRVHKHADATNPIGLLRARPERPKQRRRGRAAKQRDDRAASHSNTSPARASSVGGTSRPSALAVLRLRTSSIFTACSTGRSAGLTPRRILPVELPTRWYASARLLP